MALTRQVADAITQEDWEEAESIEKERLTLLQDITPLLDACSERSEVIDLMEKIRSMDADIISLLVRERDQIARQLLHIQNTSQAEKAYRSYYED